MHTSIGRRMRFQALACDFDGTLAMHGIVAAGVIRALKNLSESGRRLILVSGRRLDDLFQVFPDLDIFDYVVVENGAILYKPDTRKVKWLTEPVSKSFISALRARNVSPLEIGGAIVATWHPNEIKVLEAINELGLDLHITFNKGAVMVLPPTVNKATGLAAALSELNLSRHNVVTVGDAENDHVMLQMSECGVAVSNGLPSLKEHSDFVTRGDHGYGVIELIDRILLNDLAECDQTLTRHNVVLGKTSAENEIKFNPQDCQMLIAGPSQSGKSTIATAILERLAASHYQYCVIDPEGDYESAPRAVILGNRHSAPEIPDILKALENPDENVVINLLGVDFPERPRFLASLYPNLLKLRQATGRPHCLLIDEAHHMLHPYWQRTIEPVFENGIPLLIVTVNPKEISADILKKIDVVLAVGDREDETLTDFCQTLDLPPPSLDKQSLGWGEALVWFRHQYEAPQKLSIAADDLERHRHRRKYADGDVGRDRSFYFTGPHRQLNIRTQNLLFFVQVADGVDDETWLYHLRKGDYSKWFKTVINDQVLADQMALIEQNQALSAAESRLRTRQIVSDRYTQSIKVY